MLRPTRSSKNCPGQEFLSFGSIPKTILSKEFWTIVLDLQGVSDSLPSSRPKVSSAPCGIGECVFLKGRVRWTREFMTFAFVKAEALSSAVLLGTLALG